MRLLCTLLLALSVLASAHAESPCRVYKTFRTVANSTVLLDTIVVSDDMPVAVVEVSRISVYHPAPDTLSLSLAHIGGADVGLSPVALRPAASPGVFVPETTMDTSSAGQWVLRIADTRPEASR
jgi:hypothetical protein